MLATAEALDNALLACQPVDCKVEVIISLIADYVCIEVRDAGGGIRGGCLDLVKLADQGEEHGRGLYLMRELMESLELVPRSQGTLVRMTKLLGGREPADRPKDSTRLANTPGSSLRHGFEHPGIAGRTGAPEVDSRPRGPTRHL